MKRLLVCLSIVVAVLVPVVALTSSANAAAQFFRQSGNDRYGTAAAVSLKAFPNGADNVFLASGTSFPDALAGAPYAAALGGPILLVERTSLPSATAGELDRLNPKTIYLLGGTAAIADSIAQSVSTYASVDVRRISGTDRYDTAAQIAAGFNAPTSTVYIASGRNFPDALAGGAAIGGTTGGPILLVQPGSVPQPTIDQLNRLKPGTIFVLGGPAAISDSVVDALKPYSTNAPIRRAGTDRYDTAVHVADAFATAPIVYLARGDAFADAMAAGASAGFLKGPILLVPHDCIPFQVDITIQRLNPTQVIVLGGTAALSDAVLNHTVC
jgi:putative cell wall-binding protein